MDKKYILSTLQKHKKSLKKLGVKKIGLFGSYVRGEADHESDIDLLVIFEEGKKNFRNFMGVAQYLEEIFGRRIEIVTKESLSPYIGPHILEEVEYAVI